MQALKKLELILTKSEIRQFIFLSIGTLFLSISETFGIGIIIPTLNCFMKMEKIKTSYLWELFCRMSGTQDSLLFLTILVLAAILLFVFKAAFGVFMLQKQQRFIYNVFNRLTSDILSSYLCRPYAFHLENNSSTLFKNMIAEIGQFTNGYLTPVILIISEALVTIGIFLLLIWAYPTIIIFLVVIFFLIMTTMNLIFSKKIKSYSHAREKHCDQMFKTALESLQAVKEIKVYNVHNFFVDKFSHANQNYTKSIVNFNVISGLPRYILETVLFITAFGILLVSMHLQQSFIQIVPMMIVMGVASLKLLPSINKVYTNFNLLHFSRNSLDIVYDIFYDAGSQEKTGVEHKAASRSDGTDCIRLSDITFSYKTAPKPIFENLNVSIPLKSSVAFVGATGAGKSTLIDIVMGLLTPSKGSLYYKDQIVNEGNMAEYRKRIGYVPQQILLLDDTLEANIAFGVPEEKIDHKHLEQVIKMVQLESFVNELPLKTRTKVGERGVRLSGGQRQRIGIARALYRNPEILVMDEATSSLDGHTEAEVNRAINQLSGKLTVIIIAHRLSTIENADIVYVMERGNVVAQGAFGELIKDSAVLRKVTNQRAGF